MELAAFASFAALVLAWIVLPVRSGTPTAAATAPTAPGALPEPVAA